jgi:hypothetical protein
MNAKNRSHEGERRRRADTRYVRDRREKDATFVEPVRRGFNPGINPIPNLTPEFHPRMPTLGPPPFGHMDLLALGGHD